LVYNGKRKTRNTTIEKRSRSGYRSPGCWFHDLSITILQLTFVKRMAIKNIKEKIDGIR
jgi:hypothetical protein